MRYLSVERQTLTIRHGGLVSNTFDDSTRRFCSYFRRISTVLTVVLIVLCPSLLKCLVLHVLCQSQAPSLACSVPKLLKVPNLAHSVPKPFKWGMWRRAPSGTNLCATRLSYSSLPNSFSLGCIFYCGNDLAVFKSWRFDNALVLVFAPLLLHLKL